MSESESNDAGLGASELPELSPSMELLLEAQKGDQEALNSLLERYQDRLRRIVGIQLGGKLRQEVESMDIVQEANITAVRNIQKLELRSTSSILLWLSKIAMNKINDANRFYFKAQKRDGDLRVSLEESPREGVGERRTKELPGDDSLPEERVWRKELREVLDDAMTKLPPDYREVILLRDYCAGDWEFVAAEMERDSIGAVRELHRRAWIKLRRIVRPKLGRIV